MQNISFIGLTMLPVQKKAEGWTRNRKSPGLRSQDLTPRPIEGKTRLEDLCKTSMFLIQISFLLCFYFFFIIALSINIEITFLFS